VQNCNLIPAAVRRRLLRQALNSCKACHNADSDRLLPPIIAYARSCTSRLAAVLAAVAAFRVITCIERCCKEVTRGCQHLCRSSVKHMSNPERRLHTPTPPSPRLLRSRRLFGGYDHSLTECLRTVSPHPASPF